MGQRGHSKSKGLFIYINMFFSMEKKRKSSISNRIFCTPQSSISS